MERVKQPSVVMDVVTDSTELAKAREQDQRFDRNWAWFETHAGEIYAQHRGKCICVAGEKLFVADTPEDVLNLARSAYPGDDGLFTRYIPLERAYRIYANSRSVAPLR